MTHLTHLKVDEIRKLIQKDG